MITSYRFNSLKPGPHIVILGAIHGNEPCGAIAIKKIISEIEQSDLELLRGTLTCVPICNPEAYKRNTRFFQRNLNRSLYPKNKPKLYEDFIDPIICKVLDEADVLLDLHSYESKGPPFGFLGNTSQREIDYCLALGIDDFVYGWSEAFDKTTRDSKESMGTTEYARSVGCIATTIECGHHYNENAPDIAYRTIRNALKHLGMADYKDNKKQFTNYRFAKMKNVFFKEKEGKVTRFFEHYSKVRKGEVLAEYVDGETINAPGNGYIILPKMKAEVGGEWFYFAEETECPQQVST